MNHTNYTILQTTLASSSTTAASNHNVEIYPPGLTWFLNSLMVVVSLLGLAGNILVCHFFIKKKIQSTSFNILLLNLSIADLLAVVFAYPTIFVDLKMLRGFSQSTANISCAFTIGVTPFGIVTSVSVLTLAYISLNRFVFVRFPLKTAWFKSRKVTGYTLLVIWIASIAYVIPNIFAFHFDEEYAVCYREWPEIINSTLWSLSGTVFGLIAPIAIMLLTFFSTLRKFKTMTVASSQHEAMKKKRRAVRLLGFLMLAFFISWGPPSIYLLLSLKFESIWPAGVEGEYARMRVIRVMFLIALTNPLADPVLYGYFNLEFQKCFKDVFKGMKTKLGFESVSAQNNTASTLQIEDSASKGTVSNPPNKL
eukprot:Seg1234.6 transcript_id=Seg1234.6/GoldUCD/mRNA.D3Y31 product="Neuropeptide FF receptor 2" protein_id=Seg1234.6/GoldUCD/D3Y31